MDVKPRSIMAYRHNVFHILNKDRKCEICGSTKDVVYDLIIETTDGEEKEIQACEQCAKDKMFSMIC